MNKNEKLIFIGSILLTILFNELFIFGGFGVSVFIYLIMYYLMLFTYCKKCGIRIVLKKNILLIPIALCSFCFVLFDNNLLKFFNIIFLWFIVIMNTANITRNSNEERPFFKCILDVFKITVIYPFNNIAKCLRSIKNNFKGNSKDKLIIFWKIALGFMIGLIMLIIIIPLLMSSDAAFYGMIRLMIEDLSFTLVFSIFKQAAAFIIIFFPMYSFIYGITNESEDANKSVTAVQKKEFIFDFTIIITFISVIAAIYFLFCFSQFSYFISAFAGILPKDYSYSQYARKGFFEAIPLSMINFMLIVLLNKLFYQSNKSGRKLLVKIYSFFICSFSLFIVITAISKLVLYMKAYGLTILRIYSAWFLIVLSLILIIVYLKCIYKKINVVKSMFTIFTIMFILLNYINVDYIVGKYNSMLYADNKIGTIETFEHLSLSASEPLCSLNIEKNDGKSDDYTVRRYKNVKKRYEKRVLKKEKWQQWNVSKYNAEKVLFND